MGLSFFDPEEDSGDYRREAKGCEYLVAFLQDYILIFLYKYKNL